jgi:DNA-binding PadR family transcriptional regulator
MRTPHDVTFPFGRFRDGLSSDCDRRGRHRGGPRLEDRHRGGGLRHGGPRARRGDVRLAILALLAQAPANGYSLIGQISDRTDGRWRPSPGSIYPVLRQLTEDGLIAGEDVEAESAGFTITDAGRAFLVENQAQADRVWENGRGLTDGQEALHQSMRKLMGATRELAESGTEEQRQQAVKLLDDVRRTFYGMLAE